MSSSGIVKRDTLSKVFNGNDRMIKGYDLLQNTVFDDPFINAGIVMDSLSVATKAIPINIEGTIYYIKLSTTP